MLKAVVGILHLNGKIITGTWAIFRQIKGHCVRSWNSLNLGSQKAGQSLEGGNCRELDSWPTSGPQTCSLIVLCRLDLPLYCELQELKHTICSVSEPQCPHLASGSNKYLSHPVTVRVKWVAIFEKKVKVCELLCNICWLSMSFSGIQCVSNRTDLGLAPLDT